MRYLIGILIVLMLLGGSSAVRYPAGFFSGDIDMMGYNFTNASSLGTFPNSYLSGNFWVGGTSALNATTATSLDVNGATTCRNVTLDANYHIVQSGTGSYTGGTGAFDVNGAMMTKAITMDSGYDLVQAGAAYITVGTTGINATASPINVLENTTLAANKNLVLSGTGTISGAATISGADGSFSDDVAVTDDLNVDGLARIDESLTVNSLTVNTTSTLNDNVTIAATKRLNFGAGGASYLEFVAGNYLSIKGNPQMDDGFTWAGVASPASGGDLNAIGGASDINYTLSSGIFVAPTGAATLQGTTTFSKTVNLAVNASTAINTVLTSSSTKTVYGINATSANATLTLPDAATVSGRMYLIGTDADPGSNYVKVTATGGDKIGGAAGYTIMQTTDANAGLTVVSDGTRYLLVGINGTWTEGTA